MWFWGNRRTEAFGPFAFAHRRVPIQRPGSPGHTWPMSKCLQVGKTEEGWRRMKKDEEGCSVLNVVTLCSSSERPRVHHGVQHGRLDFEAASKCQRMFDSDNLIALHSLHSLIDSYILHIIDIHCMKLIQSFSKITSQITVGQLAALFQRVYAAEMNLVLWWTRRGHLVGPWCSEAYERLL